jgi:ribosome-binding ATPase
MRKLAWQNRKAAENKERAPTYDVLQKVKAQLDASKPVRTLVLTKEEQELLAPYPFLSQKKVLYAANVSEKDLPHMDNPYVQKVREYAAKEGNQVIPICAKLEEEIAQLSPDERKDFLESRTTHRSQLHQTLYGNEGDHWFEKDLQDPPFLFPK